MKSLTLIVLFCAALLFVGCGTTENTNSNANAGNSNSTATSTPKAAETKTAPAETTTAGVTGVAACDEYLTRVEKCLNSPNVPEAAKTAYRQSLEQNRAAWKQAASTPQGKASLETSCQTALNAAKSFLDTCK